MDCEKFEPLLLDELYEELDEVTSAAVKRHVSGCARCGPVLEGMRRTRGLAALPMLELPDGLEDRILASVMHAPDRKEAESETQKIVPLFSGRAADSSASAEAQHEGAGQSRAARALSWAGSWAMRPQTAMAAVFLLMIGTSAFVIRSRHSSERAAAVSVTEQGEPATPAPGGPDEHDSLDSKAAAAAHGPNQPAPVTAPPVVAAGATSPVASAAGAVAFGGPADPNGSAASAGLVDNLTAGKGRANTGNAKDDTTAFGSALAASAGDDAKLDKNKEEGQARAEKKTATRGASAAPPPPSDITNAGVPGGAPYANADRDYAPRSQTVAPPMTKSPSSDPQDGFSAGMAAYRSRNFVEATRQFDGASRTGDQNAALWAAKSVKDGNGGCSAAQPRFDAIAQRSGGTWVGNEALLESARCQIALGQLDAARDKLAKLTTTSSHAAPAQQALNELNQVAAKREADRARGTASGGGYARPAAAAPARAPAKPAATASKPASVDDANKASGY